ncbi:MAG: bifunctional folylpolyglutamate synthase/dihydrofolate synthase [Chitinophagaceae bacterium]
MTTKDPQYRQTLDFLFEQLPMFTRVGAAAYKPDLGNIQALCDALGNPEKQFKSIHIAGTNGKGSSSHFLSAILQSAGYKTGLYTSPHISDFRERIRINGAMIAPQTVVDFTEKIKPLCETLQPSFFEITVAMAFDFFAQAKVDIAVIEVGLGGRLDSTNIITPEVCLITQISFDHMNLLGNTLPEIARQKAGIIKPGVPVVLSEDQPGIQPVFFAEALKQHTRIYYAFEQYSLIQQNAGPQPGTQILRILNAAEASMSTYTLGVAGQYQAHNVLGVLTVCALLNRSGWRISEEAISTGLREVKTLTGLRGRFDWVSTEPNIILDVSHNEAGLKYLFEQCRNIPRNKWWIITGMVNDKDVDTALTHFPREAYYLFTQADIPRALPFETLAEKGKEVGLQGEPIRSVAGALQKAIREAQPNDLILVTGSFFILDVAYRYFGME